VLNPAARRERAGRLKSLIEAVCRGAKVHTTNSLEDARNVAAEAGGGGWNAVVAAGGDGTINAVVNGLAGFDIPLGILPVGTMNVFARELGIPLNCLEAAWRVVVSGQTREVDLAMANGSFFVQLAGAGLDAEVVRQTSTAAKRALGAWSYVVTLLRLAAASGGKIKARPNGAPAREGSFLLVGNGRYYGGPFKMFPRARLDDGLLDVLVFRRKSHWDVLRYAFAVGLGRLSQLRDVDYLQTGCLDVEAGRDDVSVEVDGELVGRLPCKFRIAPRRLRVLAPRPTSWCAGE